ncbi:MAG: hypothetical protein HQ534_03615 [Armatimonadetes bacterium]|nr:hypothetical protein [Armatimonadota bacterium]
MEYNIEICKTLEQKFIDAKLFRPMHINRYDKGDILVYNVKSVSNANSAKIHLQIIKSVGGGFAGQVYKVKLLKIENDSIPDLDEGKEYAIKILIPPSNFSKLFRNSLYWIGFQGPFQLQVNPAASKSGALWQKFIRRAAKIRFDDEKVVVDIFATFIDEKLGSCGEISEWVDGRTWQLEVDDKLDILNKWHQGKKVDDANLGSPEYRAKREFMRDFVKLLHDVGGFEFARQYEWSTCKSQPNCLKRYEADDPAKGLVAVDFRAGLALLPFLPMSPGDFKLIFSGLFRGSLVQFDRGNLKKLESFIQANQHEFSDMQGMLEELKSCEKIYRNSVPDITHNHFKLLFSKKLWSTILNSSGVGWRTQNLTDEKSNLKLKNSKALLILFYIIGLIPFVGKFIIKFFNRPEWRNHYKSMLTSWKYLKRALSGKIAEKVIIWHRKGRLDEDKALKVSSSFFRFSAHLPFSILPVGLHKFLTNRQYFKDRLSNIIVRPIRLYFNSKLREEWLLDMLTEGQKKHMLTDEDAKIIHSQIKEPFIQKYLKSLAVHVCTLPITQVVSVLIAIIYVASHPEMPRAQAWGIGVGIIALFQVIPISPGSLARGLYVVYLLIRERNFKNYNIAIFLSFFKYIGYLAFPIQMTQHYPALARFMAGHWATEAVHIIPVFGEQGALLEHWVFNLFYNWPLTIRRRMKLRAEKRETKKSRYWHIPIYAIIFSALFGIADYLYLSHFGSIPTLKDIWYLVIILPLILGLFVTSGCGGAVLWKRIISATSVGMVVGIVYAFITFNIFRESEVLLNTFLIECFWRVFIFSILSTLGALLFELSLGGPNIHKRELK